MSILTKCRLVATTLLLGTAVSTSVNASTWIQVGSAGIDRKVPIKIPVPGLSQVSTDSFVYGSDTVIQLAGLGETTAVYYRKHRWQGDAASGGYNLDSDWQCSNLAQLESDNQTLKMTLTTGRYKVDVSAVMLNDTCDIPAFTANKLVSSQIYTSNEFLVINHDNLSTDIASLRQNNAQSYGQLSSYDLWLSWPQIDGAERYQLALKKDHVPFYFDLTDGDYRAELATKTYYPILDTYDKTTEQYSPHTGFGDYSFSIKYCLNNQCSKDFAYQDELTVEPLYPRFFVAETADQKSVTLDMTVDPRTPKFELWRNIPNTATWSKLPFTMPDNQTRVSTTAGGNGDLPLHYMVRTYTPGEEGTFDFYVNPCNDRGQCGVYNGGKENDNQPLTFVYNDDSPVGSVDTFVLGSNKITGWAQDSDIDRATVELVVNGQSIPQYTILANRYDDPVNPNGWVMDNLEQTLTNNGINVNQVLSFEVKVQNSPSIPLIHKTLAKFVIAGLNSTAPVAINDAVKAEQNGNTIINVLHNDISAGNFELEVEILTQPTHGTVNVNSDHTITYVPNGSSTPDNDSFTYRAYYLNNGTSYYSEAATATLFFSELMANDDQIYIDWNTDTQSEPVAANTFGLNGQKSVAKRIAKVAAVKSIGENISVTFDVLQNDVNANFGDVQVVLENAQSSGGTLTLNANNTVNYTVTGDLTFNDCFKYHVVQNSSIKSNSANICVLPSLSAKDDYVGVEPNNAIDIYVLHNDNFLGWRNEHVAPFLRTQPIAGNVTLIENGRDSYFRYTPPTNVTGEYSFTYSLKNVFGLPGNTTATVHIGVTDLPNNPASINAVKGSAEDRIKVTWSASNSGTYQLQQFFTTSSSAAPDMNSSLWQDIPEVAQSTSAYLANRANGYYFYRVRSCSTSISYACSGWTHTNNPVLIDIVDPTGPFNVADSTQSTYVADITSDNIGTLPGAVAISGSAATYNISLVVPPGRMDMKPSLSLAYSSNGNNGVVGQGWSLSAGGNVSRCGATFAIDKTAQAMNYSDSDKLCLNGERLIAISGSEGELNSTYRPQTNPTTLVTLKGADWNSTASYFEVLLPTGKIETYGSTADSIETEAGAAAPRRWLLRETKDLHDNNIRYVYNQSGHFDDADIGDSHFLTSIKYTGMGSNDGDRLVELYYQSRDDIRFSYHQGGEASTNVRLDRIETYAPSLTSSSAELVSTYDLQYQDEVANEANYRKSILKQVQQCFGDNCLPATTIETHNLAQTPYSKSAFQQSLTGVTGGFTHQMDTSNDYDGDGILDVKTGNTAVLSTTNASISLGDWFANDIPRNGPWHTPSIRGRNIDFNLDGRTDYFGFDSITNAADGSGIKGFLGFSYYNGEAVEQILLDNNSSSPIPFACQSKVYLEELYPSRKNWLDFKKQFVDCSVYVLDINKDGKQDLLVTDVTDESIELNSRQTKLKVYLNTHSGSAADAATPSFAEIASAEMLLEHQLSALRVMDIDGDGYDELITILGHASGSSPNHARPIIKGLKFNFADDATLDLPSTLEGKLTVSNFEIVTPQVGGTKPNSETHPDRDIITLDVNQDGLIDLLFPATAGSSVEWHFYINHGGSFVISGKASANSKIDQFAVPLDYNRDGIMDLLVRDSMVEQALCIITTCLDDEQYLKPHQNAFNVYSWKLLEGKVLANGNYNFENSTDIIDFKAPSSDVNIIDWDMDGYDDLMTRLGRKDSVMEMTGDDDPGIYVALNNNSNTDLAYQFTNGLGHKTTVTYQNMVAGGSDFYSVTNTTKQFPYINFGATDALVSRIETDNGTGENGRNIVTYRYRDATYHMQGRGFQGFGYITEIDAGKNTEVDTQYFQHFPYAGTEQHQVTTANSRVIAENLVEQSDLKNAVADAFANGSALTEYGSSQALLYIPYVAKQTSHSYKPSSTTADSDEVYTSTEVTKSLDGYGNVTTTTTKKCDGKGGCAGSDKSMVKQTTITNSYEQDGDWLDKLNSTTSTSKINYATPLDWADNNVTRSTTQTFNSYNTERQVTKLTVEAWDAPQLVTETDYHTSGNSKGQVKRVTKSSTTNDADLTIEGDRWIETQYSSDGYFVTSKQNSQWGTTVNASSQLTHPQTGMKKSETDALGITTNYSYDELWRITRNSTDGKPDSVSGLQSCTGIASGHCQTGEVYRKVKQTGVANPVYTYLDFMGRAVRNEAVDFNGDSLTSSTSYDEYGRVLQQSDESGSVTFTGYDALGRPASKIVNYPPQQYTVNYSYDGLTTTMEVLPNNNDGHKRTVNRTMNSEGQLMSNEEIGIDELTQASMSQTAQYRYDVAGATVVIVGPTGITSHATYNGLGHKVQLDDPNQGTTQFKYNALGEMRWQKDANQVETWLKYDQLGRITERSNSAIEEGVRIWHYDSQFNGSLDSEHYGVHFSKTYTYDDKGRVTRSVSDLDDNSFTTSYTYDSNFDRLKGMRYPDGTVVLYNYSNKGHLIGEKDTLGNQYRTIEALTKRNNTGTYTSRYRLRNGLANEVITLPGGSITTICTQLASNTCGTGSIQHISYDDWDDFGNLERQVNHGQMEEESYYYDALNRLKKVERKIGIAAPINIEYDYDLAGNLNKKTDFSINGNAYGYGDDTRSLFNAGPNAVTQVELAGFASSIYRFYQYDANGNIIRSSVGADRNSATAYREISYDSNNKPTFIDDKNHGKFERFYYDSNGNRYKQITSDGVTTYYVDGLYEKVIESGTTTTKAYIGDYAVLTRSESSRQLHYLHKDRVGSVETITDGDNTVSTIMDSNVDGSIDAKDLIVEQRVYDVFGQARAKDNDNAWMINGVTSHGFTGHEHLQSGLIHMNGRAYDPALGRFLSVDPFIVMPENGQSINPYSYVMNNPLKYTDPSGYSSEETESSSTTKECTSAQDCVDVANEMLQGCKSNCNVVIQGSDGKTYVFSKVTSNGAKPAQQKVEKKKDKASTKDQRTFSNGYLDGIDTPKYDDDGYLRNKQEGDPENYSSSKILSAYELFHEGTYAGTTELLDKETSYVLLTRNHRIEGGIGLNLPSLTVWKPSILPALNYVMDFFNLKTTTSHVRIPVLDVKFYRRKVRDLFHSPSQNKTFVQDRWEYRIEVNQVDYIEHTYVDRKEGGIRGTMAVPIGI